MTKPRSRCIVDPTRQAAIAECMSTFGVRGEGEWPWNTIATSAVAYSCGAICRSDAALEHHHDPEELRLCRRLAAKAAKIMAGTSVGMGSASDSGFHPFFIASNVGDEAPRRFTERQVRLAFGGTLHPGAKVTLESLTARGQWWKAVRHDGRESGDEYFRPWRALIQWFREQPDLHAPTFVMVDRGESYDWTGGCILPRMALSLTEHGSIVGLFGSVSRR